MCVYVCVWQEWISVCVCVSVYFHLKSKPTVRCQPTYLRTKPQFGTPMHPSHPHTSWAWQCPPLRAGLHSFSPHLLPVPLQQWRSSHVTFDQSVRLEPSSPHAGHPYTQTWALRTGAQLSGALQGRKDYPLPSMPWHTQVGVWVCVCVCAGLRALPMPGLVPRPKRRDRCDSALMCYLGFLSGGCISDCIW